jgi:hypothetical protein
MQQIYEPYIWQGNWEQNDRRRLRLLELLLCIGRAQEISATPGTAVTRRIGINAFRQSQIFADVVRAYGSGVPVSSSPLPNCVLAAAASA